MNTRLKILIAEQDFQMLNFYSIASKSLGHHVVGVVHSADELTKAHAKHLPEIVLCALTLSDTDGVEAAGRINRIKPVPFVLVAAHLTESLLGEDIRMSPIACLLPPVDVESVKAAIMTAFEKFNDAATADSRRVHLT